MKADVALFIIMETMETHLLPLLLLAVKTATLHEQDEDAALSSVIQF